jgi:hypothetical protein
MNVQAENPAVVYQQIENREEHHEESCPQQDEPAEVEMTYTAENQAIIDNSTKWVFFLILVQMVRLFSPLSKQRVVLPFLL